MNRVGLAVAAAATAAVLTGCAYDYAQRTDRIAYSAGDAVKANLEMQTENPLKRSQRNTKGLGKNGVVIAPAIVPDDGE